MKTLKKFKIKHDKKADAIYIYINNNQYSHGKDLDEERRIDYDSDNQPIGIELLCVSEGVIVDELPYQYEVEKLLIDKHTGLHPYDWTERVRRVW